MNRANRFLVFIAVLIVLAACAKHPDRSTSTDNVEFTVDTLFTYEGCTVYRFKDAGRNIYYANCGTSVEVQYQHSCGKGCTRNNQITTEYSAIVQEE